MVLPRAWLVAGLGVFSIASGCGSDRTTSGHAPLSGGSGTSALNGGTEAVSGGTSATSGGVVSAATGGIASSGAGGGVVASGGALASGGVAGSPGQTGGTTAAIAGNGGRGSGGTITAAGAGGTASIGGATGTAGSAVAGQAGAGGQACVPKTCGQLFLSCGTAVDNCGGPLDCGTCPRGYQCGVTGVANVCGMTSSAPACREGWCWTRHGAFAGDFQAVVGFAADDVWFAGAHGTLWHYQGTTLEDRSAPDEHQRFWDLWASGPRDFWFTATDGVRHFDGQTWRREEVPGSAAKRVWGSGTDVWAASTSSVFHREDGVWVQTGISGSSILGGWASGPSDVWVVGGTTSGPFVHHFDGTSWATVDVGVTTGYARAIVGTGPHDVYLVVDGALRHYDGSAWSELAPRNAAEPTKLWLSSDGTLWAAGYRGLMRWDGAWHAEEVPTAAELTAVWGTGSELWVTGRWGTLLHKSGTSWTRPAAAGTFVGTTAGVSASAADDVWVATTLEQVLHHDGARWNSLPQPFDCSFDDVWVGSRGRPWLVGTRYQPTSAPCVVEWDGTTWLDHTAGLDATTRPGAIWGQAPDDLWVGGNPGLAHFDGQAWTSYANTMPILDISGSASNRVAAVGVGVEDDELRWNGTTWTAVSTQLFPNLLSPHFVRGVWVSPTTYWVSADDGLVGRSGSTEKTPTTLDLGRIHGVGSGDNPALWTFEDTSAGRVLERVGGTWRFAATPRRRNPTSVWATSATDAWIVANDGLIHYDGTRYSDPDGLPLWALRGFSALGDDDVWAAAGSFVAHWDGGDWSEVFAADAQIKAVYAADSAHVYAGTDASGSGALYRFDGQTWTSVWSSLYWGVTSLVGFGPKDVWFGGGSTVGHYDGATFRTDYGSVVSTLSALWGWSPSDLWAGGTGSLSRYDGTSWIRQTSPTTSVIGSIWGSGPNDVWIVGGKLCELYRFDGNAWSPQTLPDCSGVTFHQAWGSAPGSAGNECPTASPSTPWWAPRSTCGAADPGILCASAGRRRRLSPGCEADVYSISQTTMTNQLVGSARCEPCHLPTDAGCRFQQKRASDPPQPSEARPHTTPAPAHVVGMQ